LVYGCRPQRPLADPRHVFVVQTLALTQFCIAIATASAKLLGLNNNKKKYAVPIFSENIMILLFLLLETAATNKKQNHSFILIIKM